MTKNNFDHVVSKLGSLKRDELIGLRDIINDLIDGYEDIQAAIESNDDQPRTVKAGSGYVELKRIRGYGPYAYLRRWRGKVHTSTYLGKARS